MSLGYAEKLSYREDIGAVGQKELLDDADIVETKCRQLSEMIKSSEKLVVMTGAGISTSCGIPDFRGPNGVWTCQKQGRPLPKLDTTFVTARPSLTHMALVALLRSGKLRYVVSQNVDGLHRRSGVPASHLAELHGNSFSERCPNCSALYVRDFEMPSVGFQPTGRPCTAGRGKLRDFILDWEDALPEKELQASEEHAQAADLLLCLGTSLQIRPVCQLPLVTKRRGGRVAIVNLQKTPKNRSADLVIHSRCDGVLRAVMRHLGLRIPRYVRWEHVALLGCVVEHSKGVQTRTVIITAQSTHGRSCPLPIVHSIRWSIVEAPPHANSAGTAPPSPHAPDPTPPQKRARSTPAPSPAADPRDVDQKECLNWHCRDLDAAQPAPIAMTAEAAADSRLRVHLQLMLSDGADAPFQEHAVQLEIDCARLPAAPAATDSAVQAASAQATLSVVSQVSTYMDDDRIEMAFAEVKKSCVRLECRNATWISHIG